MDFSVHEGRNAVPRSFEARSLRSSEPIPFQSRFIYAHHPSAGVGSDGRRLAANRQAGRTNCPTDQASSFAGDFLCGGRSRCRSGSWGSGRRYLDCATRRAVSLRNVAWRPTIRGSPATSDLQPTHVQVLAAVLQSGKARAIVPSRQPLDSEIVWNPSPYLLIAAPWNVDGMPLGVLEIVQRPGLSPQTQDGYVAFAAAICELIAEYCRNRLFHDFRLRSGHWTRLTKFACQVHKSLDLKATAHAIANDGRSLLGCDRLTVIVHRGRRRYRTLAVSGVESFQRRAALLRRLEHLTRCVSLSGEPLWFPEKTADLPPQVEERWPPISTNRTPAGWPCCRWFLPRMRAKTRRQPWAT